MKGGNFNSTPIDRVNTLISNITLTIQVLYLVINLRTRPIHLTTFWVNIRGLFNPTLIDRVSKLMTNNIRSTYNCQIVIPLWSFQDKSIKPFVSRANKIGYSSISSSDQRSKETADQRCLPITILENGQKTYRQTDK